jgi:probable addiction module antidote protein
MSRQDVMTRIADRPHDDAMAETFGKDPALAAEMLTAILADGDHEELLVALRQIARAKGSVASVAARAGLNPTQLYRTLSPAGNPTVDSLAKVLKALGLRLAVQAVDEAA